MSGGFRFLKGHGTENDFVLLPDPDGSVHGDLSAGLVRALCDRRAGIGGDGVLRAVRTDAYADQHAAAARGNAEWFMDYRNADGSPSEMCGNGIRLFARYLVDQEGVDPDAPIQIGTRGGIRIVRVDGERITTTLGPPRLLAETKVGVAGHTWPATHVNLGNPHAVAFVDSLDDVGPLTTPPEHDEALFPEGVNVEFVVRQGERHLAMRVHERGSGETRSCGTGAGAAMVAAATVDGAAPGSTYRVDVPGGSLEVTWRRDPDEQVLLAGPAVIVAEGITAYPLSLGL